MGPRAAIVPRDIIRVWREMFERTLEEGGLAGADAERAVSLLDHMLRAEPTDASLLERLDGVIAIVDEAQPRAKDDALRMLISLRATMGRAREEGMEAIRHMPLANSSQPARVVAVATFMASVGTPRLHSIARVGMRVASHLDDDLDLDEVWDAFERDDDFAETAVRSDAVRSDAVVDARATSGELRTVARDCIEDIGCLGMLRAAHGAARRHAGIARFEHRLLACLDALAALGTAGDGTSIDVVAELERHHRRAAVVDPMRAFAHVFVLCCIEGEDTARAAFAALRRAHPDERAAMLDALALAPHPSIGPASRRLAQDRDPALAALALDVLRRRDEVDFGGSALLVEHHAPEVRAAAARGLVHHRIRDAAVDVLTPLLERERDDEVAATVAETLIILDARAGLEHARRLAERTATPAVLQILALAGGRSEAALLAAQASDDPAWARAVGWLGSAALGDSLAARIACASNARFVEAGTRALIRIGGALPGIELGDEQHERPALDAASVARAWSERRLALDDSHKLRFGAPLTFGACLDELELATSTGDDRERAATELALLSAGFLRVEPHDWTSRQQAQIALARELVLEPPARALYRRGEWPSERLGQRWAATAPWRQMMAASAGQPR